MHRFKAGSGRGALRRLALIATTMVVATTTLAVVPTFVSTAQAAPSEKMVNAGFEVDADGNGVPDGWSYHTEGAATAALDSTVSYAGGKSVRLQGSSSADRANVSEFYQAAAPGKRYHASVRAKTSSVSAQYVSLVVGFYDASNNSVGFTRTTGNQGTHGWELIDTFVESPPNAVKFTIQASLEFGSGTVWFDNASMVVADGQNVVPNSNFETDVDSNGVPDGWSHETLAGGSAALVSTEKYEGVKSEKLISPTTSGRAYASKFYLPAEENTSYDFSTYLKTDSVVMASGTNLLGLDVTFYDADHTVLLQKFYRGSAGTHGWERVKGTQTSPLDTALVTIRVGLDFGSGTAWFDKVEMAESQRANVLKNSGMEGDTDRNSVPDSWDFHTSGGGAATIDGSTADEGEGAVKLSGTAASSFASVSRFAADVSPGSWYRLSLRYKMSNVTARFAGLSYALHRAPCDKGNVHGTCVNPNDQVTDNVEFGPTSTTGKTEDWTTLSTVIYTPPGTARLDFRGILSGSGTMWVDDTRLEKLSSRPAVAFNPETSLTKGAGSSSTLAASLTNNGSSAAWIDKIRLLEGDPNCAPAESTSCSWKPHPAVDTTCERTPTKQLTFTSSTTATDGSTAYTVSSTGGTYSPGRHAFSVSPGMSLKLTVAGDLGVDGSQVVAPIQVHEQRADKCFGYKVLQSGYGSMTNATVTAKAPAVLAAFSSFDSYLDSTSMFSDPACGTAADHRCGWKTTHDYLVTPNVRGQESTSVSSLYEIYADMFDMTGVADYQAKARIAADQLIRIQQPDGGFSIPWDYTDPFGQYHAPTESVGPTTALAITTLANAYERFTDTKYRTALEDAVDYFTDSPGTTNILWMDSAHTRASVPYHSISYTPTINGVTGPDIETYNVDSLVMLALDDARKATGDSSLVPYINGLANNLRATQAASGGWPYAWRFVGANFPTAYNFVQARAFADLDQQSPNTQVHDMAFDVLGYLGDQMEGFPVLNRNLADVRSIDMTLYWKNYIAGGLCAQGPTGAIMNSGNYCTGSGTSGATANDRRGMAYFEYAINSLREAGYTA